jgi:hypothetical protein
MMQMFFPTLEVSGQQNFQVASTKGKMNKE